jgi:histidine triad (HIT) family protein
MTPPPSTPPASEPPASEPPASASPASDSPAPAPPSAACVFDRIRDGQLPAHLVLDEPDVLAFLDHHPLFVGHTLVVPRPHLATLAELPAEVAAALFAAARRIAAAQRQVLGSQGTFPALNDVVSQSVPHVHFHVVPRARGDGLRGFFWPRTRYASTEDAATLAARLRQALAGPCA